MYLTSSPSSLLITCPYHLSLASLTFSSTFTSSHLLLIFSFHNVSDQLSFLYHLSLASLIFSATFTSSHLLLISLSTMSLTSSPIFAISALLPSPSLQYLSPHIFVWSLYPQCLWDQLSYLCHLIFASLTFSAMSITSHLLLISLSTMSLTSSPIFAISALLPSPSLQYLSPHIFFWSLYSIMSLTSFPIFTISALFPSPSLQCLSSHIFFWSLHSILSLTSSPSSPLLHVHTISSLLPSPSLQCLPLHIFFSSLHCTVCLRPTFLSLFLLCVHTI